MMQARNLMLAVGLTLLLVVGVAFAQMGSGGHNHGNSVGHTDAMSSKRMTMFQEMSQRHHQMMSTFDELDEHFQGMMHISDMQLLREQMMEHRDLVVQMRDHMVAQRGGWQHMMNDMGHMEEMPHDMTDGRTGCNNTVKTGCGH